MPNARVLFLSMLLAMSTSAAVALENCDAIKETGAIEKRLQCLQANNNELQKRLDELSKIALRDGVVVSVKNGVSCFQNFPQGAVFRECGVPPSDVQRWTLTRLP